MQPGMQLLGGRLAAHQPLQLLLAELRQVREAPHAGHQLPVVSLGDTLATAPQVWPLNAALTV